MNIDKCTVEALKVLEQRERAGVKVGYKTLSKRAKIIAIVSAFAVMMTATGIAVNAANPAPLTSETIAEAQIGSVYLYTRDYVNVRSGAEFGDNVLCVSEPKTKVKLLGVDGDWSYIEINGVKAYIYSHYLSTEELEYTGDCDTDDEEDTLVKEKIAAAKNKVDNSRNEKGLKLFNYMIDEDETDVESEKYLSPSGVEIEQYPYNVDGVYYGTTAAGNDVYRNDSGLFDAYSSDGYMTADEFKHYGIVNYNGECFTYYSEQDLPGEGLEIPGRYTDWEGYVCDGEGYVVLATPDEYTHPRGSVIELPTGRMGRFYDFCPEGSIDVYVNW